MPHGWRQDTLVCIDMVCIMAAIYGMYWHVLFLVCITCSGKYWYVFRGHVCKYSYVFVSIGMYKKWYVLYILVCIDMHWYILRYIDLYWMYWYVLLCIVCTGLYL